MSVGIIAEYNPFHNGHIYQLKKAREFFPNEEIIIIMSGNYVQRGEIAIASFSKRKKMAIKYGASKVIKLKFSASVQAAHIFAREAVKIVHANGIDKLFFGSENNDPSNLMKIAQTIFKKEDEYNKLLKYYLKENGNSFPKSASLALSKIIGQDVSMTNDILGLEYCKVIVFNNYNIKPYTIKRTIDFHNDSPNNNFASASYIRQLVRENKNYDLYTPMKLNLKRKKIEDKYPKFQKIVKKMPAKKLAKIKMISEGMENLFKKHINANNMADFINKTNSKRYTTSRIKRTMLHVLFKIKK